MVDQDEVRHRLEHRHVDALPEAEASHGLWADVINNGVRLPGEAQQGVASIRMLEIDDNAALAAVGVEKHPAHARGSARPDLTNDIAVGAFHLDDIGAHVREDLGGIRSHQDRGQIENGKTAERTHGKFLEALVLEALAPDKILYAPVY